jgi:hypothetical protein
MGDLGGGEFDTGIEGRGGDAFVDRLTRFWPYTSDVGRLAYGLGYFSPSEGMAAVIA